MARPGASHGDRRERIRHRVFHDLASSCSSGDLIVVNNSSTLPASVVSDGDLVVHFSTRLPGGLHLVELRRPSGANSLHEDPRAGTTAPGRRNGRAADPLSGGWREPSWIATPTSVVPCSITWRPGAGPSDTGIPTGPIRSMPTRRSSLGYTGSKMPSAGRPFTDRLVTALTTAGIAVAPLTPTGLSSARSG